MLYEGYNLNSSARQYLYIGTRHLYVGLEYAFETGFNYDRLSSASFFAEIISVKNIIPFLL